MDLLPKITIITPSFNQGRFLEKTIQSVLNQNYPNLEYIVIDGGSSDNSVSIIKKYADKLTYWISEPDRGHTHAINKGLLRSTGEIINWLNSDDFLLPQALSAVVKAFEQNKKASFVYGDTHQVTEDGRLIYISKVVPFDKQILYYGRILGVQPSIFFRKWVIEEGGLLNEEYKFCMDIEFWIRNALNGLRFVPIYSALSANRFHSQTKTVLQQGILQHEHIRILKNLRARFIDLPEPLGGLMYQFIRNTFRYKWAIKRLAYRGDFGINRSKKARMQALQEHFTL